MLLVGVLAFMRVMVLVGYLVGAVALVVQAAQTVAIQLVN